MFINHLHIEDPCFLGKCQSFRQVSDVARGSANQFLRDERHWLASELRPAAISVGRRSRGAVPFPKTSTLPDLRPRGVPHCFSR